MDSATTYDELKDAITRVYPDMSKQLQRIARFALEKPHDLALGTVAAVAEATEVQPSAMIRFANALGYSGFSRDAAGVSRPPGGALRQLPRAHRPVAPQAAQRAARAGSVLHQLVGDSVGELGQLEESIREADMRAAVKLIAGASRIHVLAQRRAFPVASYLAYALGQLELKTHLLDGAGGMLRENLRSVASDDVLLVASFRSYSPEVVHAAQACSARGVPVIAITDGPLSPLLEPAARLLRAGGRFFQAVPLAGRAAVPGAGAGDEHRPPARREAGSRRPRKKARK